MESQSLEKFIFEHCYTKIDQNNTEEYKLQHPSWRVNQVLDYKMDCDFTAMYGDAFYLIQNLKQFYSRRFFSRNRMEKKPTKS
jgi:hypothetical protein